MQNVTIFLARGDIVASSLIEILTGTDGGQFKFRPFRQATAISSGSTRGPFPHCLPVFRGYFGGDEMSSEDVLCPHLNDHRGYPRPGGESSLSTDLSLILLIPRAWIA